jgi:recombination protein RecT
MGGEGRAVVEVFGKVDDLKTFLAERRQSFADVLPERLGITPERVIKMAVVAATQNPKLLSCTRLSVMQSLMTAAELGLDFSGTLGHAWIIPYGTDATFMIGYRGLNELAFRSGKVLDIESRIVYEHDVYEFEQGMSPKLRHIPAAPSSRGEIVAAYCVVSLSNGVKKAELMWREEIDDIRTRSKAGRSGPWSTDYGEMARKTVTRRALKWVPLTPDVEFAIATAVEGEDRVLGLGDIPAAVPAVGRHGGVGPMTLDVKTADVAAVDLPDTSADATPETQDDGTGL